MGFVALMIVVVVLIMTVANSVAPIAAAGGSNLKLLSYLGVMSLVSGSVLAVVPLLTEKIFSI